MSQSHTIGFPLRKFTEYGDNCDETERHKATHTQRARKREKQKERERQRDSETARQRKKERQIQGVRETE